MTGTALISLRTPRLILAVYDFEVQAIAESPCVICDAPAGRACMRSGNPVFLGQVTVDARRWIGPVYLHEARVYPAYKAAIAP